MAGPDKSRLVLVRTVRKSDTGEETYSHGTGYFITPDLVLTAGHVLAHQPSEVRVRLEEAPAGKPAWRTARPVPFWLDLKIDAALLKIEESIHEVELPLWGKASFDGSGESPAWNSVAYPCAAAEDTAEGKAYKSAGLMGNVYVDGGGGQGLQALELGVEHESKEQWNGISGAPIFVGEELIGIIKSYKEGFSGKRLDGVPIRQLLHDLDFQRALNPRWKSLPEQLWTLILTSEDSKDEFSITARSAIELRQDEINQIAGLPEGTVPNFVEVSITEALANPSHWYEMTEAVCKAPIMVVDVTDFQPAVMLFLGIRAVSRRGVTITATSTELDESLLSKLPFNIQESKLIYPLKELEVKDPRHPINRIGEAVVKGLTQVRGYPGYLDLPAYEAVRCPKPQIISAGGQAGSSKGAASKGPSAAKAVPERILMLCSFSEVYRKRWLYVSEKVTLTFQGVGRSLERMLDISSPRLVGQALYESIRWTPCCIVDWTHWRANVFFELGVRLACSDIGPVFLVEESELDVGEGRFPLQKKALIELLRPISYTLGGSIGSFKNARERYQSFLQHGQESFDPAVAIAHNATYRTVIQAYDWRQETFAKLPHDELRATIEVQQGKDPQKDGFQALFSSNPEFKLEIQRSGRERWIAAWYYLKNRYSWEEFKTNEELRQQLSVLTEAVVQELRELRNQSEPDLQHQRIYNEAVDLIDKLDEL